MAYIGYLFFRIIVFIFSIIPFWLLYKIADFLAWVLKTVVGYRKKVVLAQLKLAFPYKSDKEIQKIMHDSYKNLADIIVESIKGFTMSETDYRKRFIFVNPEVANQLHKQGKSSIHVAAHYGNWEWGAMTYPLWVEKPVLGFYKPLSNPYIEAYGKMKRGRYGMTLIPIGETSAAFKKYADEATTYVFVSDQSTWSDKAHWVTFLGQDTACPPGVDKYARQLNAAVYYIELNRVNRGFYEVKLELLAEPNQETQEGEITGLFMSKLEKILHQKPENWLWSHKRWKKKREPVVNNPS